MYICIYIYVYINTLAASTMRFMVAKGTLRTAPASFERNASNSSRRDATWGPGFRVQGARFRVQGSGFRVQGSGFKVYVAHSSRRDAT